MALKLIFHDEVEGTDRLDKMDRGHPPGILEVEFGKERRRFIRVAFSESSFKQVDDLYSDD